MRNIVFLKETKLLGVINLEFDESPKRTIEHTFKKGSVHVMSEWYNEEQAYKKLDSEKKMQVITTCLVTNDPAILGPDAQTEDTLTFEHVPLELIAGSPVGYENVRSVFKKTTPVFGSKKLKVNFNPLLEQSSDIEEDEEICC